MVLPVRERTPLAFRVARGLGRVLVGAYYPDLTVEGAERVPDGPLLIAANHPNSLVDPVVIAACMPRRLHWLAKAPLFERPLARAVLRAVGAIPVHRRHEGGTDATTAATLRSAADHLVGGGAIGIFPEGVSHDEPRLRPLKTGVGRLAVLAARDLAAARGASAPPVVVLPAVLHFPDPQQFRSAAHLAVGEPIAVGPLDDADAVTRAVARGLESLLVHVEDAFQERLLELVRILVRRRHAAEDADPGELHRVDREVAAAVRRFAREEPDRVAAFARALQDHVDQLDRHGLSLHALEPSPRDVKRVLLAALLLPVAAFGLLHSWIPYRLARRAALRSKDGTVTATAGLLAGSFAFPIAWAIGAAVVAAAWGPFAAAAFVALVVPTALVARWTLHVLRREIGRLVDLALVARHRSVTPRLREDRVHLWSEIERWRRLHLAGGGSAPS